MKTTKTYTVYILRTSKNTLYIGQTNDLEKRLKEHTEKSSKSSKYMKAFDSFTLTYIEKYKTRSEAMKREYELKNLSKVEKEKLIKNGGQTQRSPSTSSGQGVPTK